MNALTIPDIHPTTMRYLAAWAKINKTTVADLVRKNGVDGALNQAMQNASATAVETQEIGADVLAIISKDWSSVWSGLYASLAAGNPPPDSLAGLLEAKAAAIPVVLA